ncbi:GNAT family N-acetyltransferase [Nocardia asteroides]|uniref:GNAT family N-acetyltransferase n=1 Tax=Nocardia asteroides TaxID=1824 RepID=UPI001E5E0AF6|nr:GNAT family N-acetyltransferase [Nocardia asteroides]UGT61131.1 GNAT family N-acetyltransferase [Nocardia asteroides]
MSTPTELELKCRPACSADLARIVAIEADAFPDPYPYLVLRQLFDVHSSTWLVVEAEGLVIGYALMLENDGEAMLFTFAVHSDYRGHGYGSALLRDALTDQEKAGSKRVWLTVRPDNEEAIRRFARAGFRPSGYEEEYFGPNEPRFVYEYLIDR